MQMKNEPIEKAIEEFKSRYLSVYKADPDQIVCDTRVAERATKDHVGRWLFLNWSSFSREDWTRNSNLDKMKLKKQINLTQNSEQTH